VRRLLVLSLLVMASIGSCSLPKVQPRMGIVTAVAHAGSGPFRA
jgi:hypothetical protein